MSDDDKRVLHCNEDWFDALTWFWVVILPQLVLMYASSPGWMRGGDLAFDFGHYAVGAVQMAYIIVCMSPSTYLWKRITAAVIWLLTLEVIWFELPLWFYLVYLCVPIAWFIKHKREKKK